jgi:uncharacterized protein (TIGR03084 family)
LSEDRSGPEARGAAVDRSSGVATATREVLDDFEAEQRELETLLRDLDDPEWATPTPAAGWDVRDQVSHLADTEELAHDTATGGTRQINVEIEHHSSGDAFTLAGCLRGRAMTPAEVLEWWLGAAARNRAALRALDPAARVPWGLGMGLRAFGAARLMEHWAHGLDIRAAVGRPAADTRRLHHVAWIGARALPYALTVAGVEPPPGRTLRFDLVDPDGADWSFGPDDATDRIEGPMGEWCRLAVQRVDRAATKALRSEGSLADLALENARAFL